MRLGLEGLEQQTVSNTISLEWSKRAVYNFSHSSENLHALIEAVSAPVKNSRGLQKVKSLIHVLLRFLFLAFVPLGTVSITVWSLKNDRIRANFIVVRIENHVVRGPIVSYFKKKS